MKLRPKTIHCGPFVAANSLDIFNVEAELQQPVAVTVALFINIHLLTVKQGNKHDYLLCRCLVAHMGRRVAPVGAMAHGPRPGAMANRKIGLVGLLSSKAIGPYVETRQSIRVLKPGHSYRASARPSNNIF